MHIQQDGGVKGGEAVGDGKGEPDAVEFGKTEGRHEAREEEEAGNEEEELARQREIDALTCLADALEEITRNHLETDNGEEGDIDTHTVSGDADEVGVGGEGTGDEFGKEFAEDEAHGHHDGGVANGLVEDLTHTVVELGAVVITGDGLHALVEAHDDHGKEEENAVIDTIGSDGEVAAVLNHTSIDKENNKAGTGVHKEGRKAYAEDATHNAVTQLPGITTEEDDFRGTRKDTQLPTEGDALGDNGGDSGTPDTEVETVDEQRIEGGVEKDGENGSIHRRAGMTSRTQDGIKSEVEMGEDVAVEDPLHVLAGIG